MVQVIRKNYTSNSLDNKMSLLQYLQCCFILIPLLEIRQPEICIFIFFAFCKILDNGSIY